MSDLPNRQGLGVQGNLERFSGFADVYDRYRPRPPLVIVDVLAQLARAESPSLVVDLGSGTGLSTTIWADRAERVIGVEPNADMRDQARQRLESIPGSGNVEYREGISSATGLPDGSVDIVTVSQALHWMEPESTFAEVARILRPGGVFAAYDCDWPPTVGWEAEEAYRAFVERTEQIARERGIEDTIRRWWKSEHLDRMRQSGRFRFTKEIVLHAVEEGDADRLVGVAVSQGSIAQLLLAGATEEEIGLDVFRAEAERTVGAEPAPWYWSYRVRLGIK